MSANQSNLSKYGYDIALGVSEASINATMKLYFSKLPFKEVVVCYVANDKGDPTAIDYSTLKKNAKGSDPFTVPDGADPDKNQDILNLRSARFMAGFKAQIGLPSGVLPSLVPDIVTLSKDTSMITFTLMCSEFTITQFSFNGYAPPRWLNKSQPSGSPWLFTSMVDLKLLDVDPAQYSILTPAVKNAIKKYRPGDFSIQRLFLNLDNASVQTVPTIQGVEPGTPLYTCLQTYFVGAYFAAMKKNGEPILGFSVSVKPGKANDSSMEITSTNLRVTPFVDESGTPVPSPTPAQKSASTLNYQCAINNKRLPPANAFTWNWLSLNDTTDFHGAMAVNRKTFAEYLKSQLIQIVQSNCYKPKVHTEIDGLKILYQWNLIPYDTDHTKVTITDSGPDVLTFAHANSAQDSSGSVVKIGEMKLNTSFNVTVRFTGNTIVITQHLLIYLYLLCYLTSQDGNVVDITITDTYTLAMKDNRIVSSLKSDKTDRSQMDHISGFVDAFLDMNQLIDSVAGWVKNFTATNLTDIPLSTMQSFVFPGGNAFDYKDVSFSDNQDLVSRVTYLDPESILLLRKF